jgi:ATP-dependent HslUV protease, peptidase subunit HslV
MSTVTVVRKNGHVAIAADTLTTYGDTKESAPYMADHSKIFRVGENYIGTVGHASWDLVLKSYFRQLEELPRLDSVDAVFEFARTLHRALKDDYFLNSSGDSDHTFEATRLNCLIANPHGIFGLYSLRSVQEYTKLYAFGSGSSFALGAMWSAYDRVESAEEIARIGASGGAEFDPSSGYPVEVFSLPLLGTTDHPAEVVYARGEESHVASTDSGIATAKR